jgi:hypothetical protein
MAKVIIDDGTQQIPILNKFGKKICDIYIRPADIAILDRYQALMKDFDRIVEPLQDLDINADGTASFDQDWKVLKEVEKQVKRKIDELFDMEEADAIFATRNPFSSVGGEFFCLKVLKALAAVITDAVERETKASQKRMSKYLEGVKATPPEVTADAGLTSDEPDNS